MAKTGRRGYVVRLCMVSFTPQVSFRDTMLLRFYVSSNPALRNLPKWAKITEAL